MNKTTRNNLFALAELAVLVLLDQLSKYAAVLHLKNQSGITLLPGVFELYSGKCQIFFPDYCSDSDRADFLLLSEAPIGPPLESESFPYGYAGIWCSG